MKLKKCLGGNETVYIVENAKICLFFGRKKKRRKEHNKRIKITDGTGIYQKCLTNIHPEFLANDGKFLSLIVLLIFKG